MKRKDFKFYWEQPDKKEVEGELKDESVRSNQFTLSLPQLGLPNINVMISSMPVDIGETDREVVVRARLPGYKKSELSLNVTETTIEIAAFRKDDRIEKGERSYMRESSAGSQHMEFSLPARVDPNGAKAKLEGGILTVMMPKLEAGKKKKRIDVK